MKIRVTVTESDGRVVASMIFDESTLLAFAGKGLETLLTPGRTIVLEGLENRESRRDSEAL